MFPLRDEGKPQFAFTWERMQDKFNPFIQGYKGSPPVAHSALAKLLDAAEVPRDVRGFQCIDDILIGGDNQEQVGQTAKAGWDLLTKSRLEVPPSKCQGIGQEKKFSGV